MLVVLARNYTSGKISADLISCIERLWTDGGVKATFTKSHKYQLNDSAKYFLDNTGRILADDYDAVFEDDFSVVVEKMRKIS